MVTDEQAREIATKYEFPEEDAKELVALSEAEQRGRLEDAGFPEERIKAFIRDVKRILKGEEPEGVGPPEFGVKVPRGPLRLLGLFSSLGRAADRLSGVYVQQIIIAFLLEAWDHSDVRSNAPRYGLTRPDWGRSPYDPAKHIRCKTEFLSIPIAFLDSVTANLWVKRGNRWYFEEVPILQPYYHRKIDRKRLWTLWALHGPLHSLLTAEGRAKVRRQYPGFKPVTETNWKLIRDPWRPTSADLYKVMNPVLAKVSVEKIARMSRDELEDLVKKLGGESLVEWFPMSGFLQNSYLEYLAVVVGGGALEVASAWNSYKTVPDPHANMRFGTTAHVSDNMVTDEHGVPVHVELDRKTGQPLEDIETEEEGAEEGGALRGTPKLRKPNLRKLIKTLRDAVERYQLTKGERYDFDPDPERSRDLAGNDGEGFATGDELGCHSDTQRMAEVLYPVRKPVLDRLLLWGPVEAFKKLFLRSKAEDEDEDQPEAPDWTWGPSHSATALVAEMPAEEMVYLGKYLRHRKILSKMRRHWSTGELTRQDVAAEVARWLCTAVPEMAQKAMADAAIYLEFIRFWNQFADPKDGHVTSFVGASVRFTDLKKIIDGGPVPTDFWEMCKRLEYFYFDPIECWYGYDGDGVPRIPHMLVERLTQDPSLRGVNLALDGRRVLETYFGRDGVRRQVLDFWLSNVPANKRVLTLLRLVYRHGMEYLVMGSVLWKTMAQPGEHRRGFLYELFRAQSVDAIIQQLTEVWNRETTKKTIHIRPVYYKEVLAGLPIELLRHLSDPDRPRVEWLLQETTQQLAKETGLKEKLELEKRVVFLKQVLSTAQDLDRLTRFIQDLNRKSDRRVRLWAALQSHGPRGGIRGFQLGAALSFCEEGYGTQTGAPLEDQQADQVDLFMMAWLDKQVDQAVYLAREVVYLIENQVDQLKQYEMVGRRIGAGLNPKIARLVGRALTRNRNLDWSKLLPEETPSEVEYVEDVFKVMEEDRLGSGVVKQITEGRMHEGLDDYID